MITNTGEPGEQRKPYLLLVGCDLCDPRSQYIQAPQQEKKHMKIKIKTTQRTSCIIHGHMNAQRLLNQYISETFTYRVAIAQFTVAKKLKCPRCPSIDG